MGLDDISRGIEIVIERIEIVRGMAKTLTLTDTEEDIKYILERMHNELEEGAVEIDQMLSQNAEVIL